jgi:D-serine deaminase-like pyridoxal phosphate-dependent protein
MPSPPPADIGAPLSAVDTPALLIDLDAMTRNLERMAARVKTLGVRLRPHAKMHKSSAIAARQIALGAVGVCCQKVAEAEALVADGISDVLVSNEVVGERKLARLAALAKHARIGVCIDQPESIGLLAGAARAAGSRIDVLVEVDVGGRRCGVAPGGIAGALAAGIARCDNLHFAGLQAYHGSAQHLRTPRERRDAIAAAQAAVVETLGHLTHAGFSCETVSGAGTGTFLIEGGSGVWNELQPGSYVFMDRDYADNTPDDGANAPMFEHALFVLATVMSTTSPEQAVIDAGHKALSNDSGFPVVWQRPDIGYHRPSDEHGVLRYAQGAPRSSPRLGWGEKVLLVPGHCDPTVNLYDWYVGVRGFGTSDAHVETLWPVTARGAVT